MTATETAPTFVPSFDDDEGGDRKLAIICSKGNLDMAYPALILGNAALGEGVETHLFFTFWGFDMINKKTMEHLKFSYLGNTAMHPPGSAVSMPQGLAGMPGMTAMTTKMLKKQIADLDIPEVPEFLEQIHDVRRPSVGLPPLRRHDEAPRGGPLRGSRGHHLRQRLHRDDRRRPAVVHLTMNQTCAPLSPDGTTTGEAVQLVAVDERGNIRAGRRRRRGGRRRLSPGGP